MGKLRRGALWAIFPPAGMVASMRAGNKKDSERVVAAINQQASQPAPKPAPTPEQAIRRSEVHKHKKEIDQQLRSAGFRDKAQRMHAHMQVIRLVSDSGYSISDAIAQVIAWRNDVA